MSTSPSSRNHWQLQVQMRSTERSHEGHIIATGDLILVTPTGQQYRFPMRSGGFGRYGDRSMLPGLNGDINGAADALNAHYLLNWQSLQYHTHGLRREMSGPNGIGSWIALESLHTTRNHFGIHTDGPNARHSHAGDGTHGCIGLEPAIADAFFAKLLSIPFPQRPRKLDVLRPALHSASMDVTLLPFSGAFNNTHIPTLSATLPRPTLSHRGRG